MAVYRILHDVIDAICCLALHTRKYVAVEIERDRNLAVPEALAGDLGMNTR